MLLYSTGSAFGCGSVNFWGVEAAVKEEPERIYPFPQAKNRMFNFTAQYVIVVKDRQAFDRLVTAWAVANGVTDLEGFLHSGVRQLGLLLDLTERRRSGTPLSKRGRCGVRGSRVSCGLIMVWMAGMKTDP